MVLVFREVRRVLRDDGTLWLNLGDTYNGHNAPGSFRPGNERKNYGNSNKNGVSFPGLSAGNLVGIPWRAAFALQADGWILRQDVIWHKPAPMPESVKNRCTKAHEYVFLLTKRQRYYYDAEAIKDAAEPDSEARYRSSFAAGSKNLDKVEGLAGGSANLTNPYNNGMREFSGNRNKRSVWTVSSQGYPGAHFATFPMKLIEPMILAGTSEKGCCTDCGTLWVRITAREQLTRPRPNEYTKRTGAEGTGNSCANTVAGVDVRTVGWRPNCECHGKLVKRTGTGLGCGSDNSHSQDGVEYGLRQDGKGPASVVPEPTKELTVSWIEYVSEIPLDDHPVIPCTVLDPFIGSGTTAAVALKHGRRCWGIDLSEEYLRNHAVKRIEGVLLSRPAMRHLAGRVSRGAAPDGDPVLTTVE